MTKLDLEKRSVFYNIWQLAWPAALAAILGNLANIVDRIFIGGLGLASINAVSFAGNIIWMSFAVTELVTAGTVAVVSRNWGAEKFELAEADGHRALKFGVMIALGLTVFVVVMAPWIISLFDPTAAEYPLAVDYLRIFAPGFGFLVVAITIHSVFTGSGDTRTGMWAFAGFNLLNIFLDWLLIFGNWGFPAMGVRGAALASSISAILGTVMIIVAYRRKWSNVSIKGFFKNKLRMEDIKRFLRIGLPAFGHGVTRPITGIVMFRIASSLKTTLPDGTEVNLVVGAFAIGMSVLAFGQFLGAGLMAAPAPLVGQFLGRSQPQRAKEAAHKVTLVGLGVQALMTILFIFFGRELAMIFLRDTGSAELTSRVLDMAHRYLIFIGLGAMVNVMSWTYGGAFRGAGDTKPPMWGALLANWLIKIPVALLFAYVFHLNDLSVWLAVFFSQLFEGAYVALQFRRDKWMEAKI